MSMSDSRRAAIQIKSLVGPCPITWGRPTRMTRRAFAKICAAHRKERNNDGKFNYGSGRSGVPPVCVACKGKHQPPELEFLSLTKMEKKGGFEMSKKTGTCELCGKENASLVKNHDVFTCASCRDLQTHVSRRPELVAAELARLHGGKYVSPPADVEGLREQVASLENANLDLAAQLQEREEELNRAMERSPLPDQTDQRAFESLIVDSTANQVAEILLDLLFDPEACSMLTTLAEQLAASRRRERPA